MTVITGNNIETFRLITLRAGVRLEMAGMARSRGRSCSVIAKETLGLSKSAPLAAVMEALNIAINLRHSAA